MNVNADIVAPEFVWTLEVSEVPRHLGKKVEVGYVGISCNVFIAVEK